MNMVMNVAYSRYLYWTELIRICHFIIQECAFAVGIILKLAISLKRRRKPICQQSLTILYFKITEIEKKIEYLHTVDKVKIHNFKSDLFTKFHSNAKQHVIQRKWDFYDTVMIFEDKINVQSWKVFKEPKYMKYMYKFKFSFLFIIDELKIWTV